MSAISHVREGGTHLVADTLAAHLELAVLLANLNKVEHRLALDIVGLRSASERSVREVRAKGREERTPASCLRREDLRA